jgi:hypothetical protein
MSVRDEILARLQPLVGLRLTIARRTGGMRNLHFGEARPVERGTAGEYALHIRNQHHVCSPLVARDRSAHREVTRPMDAAPCPSGARTADA